MIAWAPEDQPSDTEIDRVLDEFEDTAWPGLAPNRYAWTAVRHREAGRGVHVHVVAARCDLETGKSLNIRRGRLEGVEPVKPCPAQDPTDGGGRHPHGPRHLDPRLALEAQRRDAGDDTNRRGPGLSSRPRTAIAEARWAFGLIPGDPLAHRPRTDARGSRDEAYWQLVIEHAGDQFGSTRGGGSGILMALSTC